MPNQAGKPVFDVFAQYATYYDLLYRDKDYLAEAQFIHERFSAHGGAGGKLLELGCGTGRHAVEFAKLGYTVTGIDLSENMVQLARQRIAKLGLDGSGAMSFAHGDVRTARLGIEFDVVASLFHVMSYQVATPDICATFKTAAAHLKPGGLFLFDFWHGKAVLADPPGVRIKRLEDANIEVTRIAEPTVKSTQNCVIVNYQIFLKNKLTGVFSEIREAHPMRYLFLEEIIDFASDQGFAVVESGGWGTGKPLGADTWYGYVIARKS